MTFKEFCKKIAETYRAWRQRITWALFVFGILLIGYCMGADMYNGLLLLGVAMEFVAAMIHFDLD